jgi:branched-chain amino acid transport system permease protein
MNAPVPVQVNIAPRAAKGLIWGLIPLVIILLGFPLVFKLPFPLHIATQVLMYGALGAAWNVLGGYVGRVSFGAAAFFGLGAYVSLLGLTKFGISPLLGIPIGMVLASVIAYLVGTPTLRLKGHYFSLATIALGEFARIVFVNLEWAGGSMGVEAPLKPNFLNLTFHEKSSYYYIALVLAALTALGVFALVRGKAGYYWRAIRGDEDAARTLGVKVEHFKRLAFVVSSAITALWGGFFAYYVGFIDPDSVFALHISTQIVLVATLGGVGTLLGPWLGALVLIPLSELTRAGLGGGGKGLDLFLYGLIILLIALYQPGGLMAIRKTIKRGKNARGS